MYPGRGVLHTPQKCPHRGQTDRPIWIDRPMCLFVLTPSIPELFISNDFRSLPVPFVVRMQYALTVIRKCYVMIRSFRSLSGSFVGRMQYALTMIRKCYAMIRSFRSLPGSLVRRMQYATTLPDEKRRSQNVSAVLFEAQNGVQMLFRCFLRLKIESKYS